MKRITTATVIAMAIALSGCSRIDLGTKDKSAKPAAAAKHKAPAKRINKPVEDAMAQIPPEMRTSYQDAFACEVKRRMKTGDKKAIEITPAYVHDLFGRLKADPGIAKC